jgi:hypothetical protein
MKTFSSLYLISISFKELFKEKGWNGSALLPTSRLS